MPKIKLAEVDCRYGAPMGRQGKHIGPPEKVGPVKLHLEVVPLNSGGYDSGGAYWGLRSPIEREVLCTPIGETEPRLRKVRQTPRIYRFYWKNIIEGFIDAFDREDAKKQIRTKYPDSG